MHVEHLDWLANNPRYTQRFAMHVGKLCRDMPNKAVAEMERLHHSTVKDLDKLYMQKQVDLAGLPAPRAIGIDEISIRKGHNYRVIVSDLDRERPIWVGGEGRKEADIDLFFKALGEKKSARIELAAMDMWKAFRNSVMKNAPNARIIYDKFHIMRHLSKALDEVRRSEYKRLSGKDRSYIKGQRYTLLSRRKNLSLNGRRALKKLLEANRRLNTAYLLKETFGQLWDYRTERGARAFFERWQDSLKWQRLQPYRRFAELIESHWDGIASYCHPEHKVSLGLVEGIKSYGRKWCLTELKKAAYQVEMVVCKQPIQLRRYATMSKHNVVELAGREKIRDELTDLIREGACKLIAQGLELEVSELLSALSGRQDEAGRAAVVRNGYQPERDIQTGIGPVTVKVPKIRSRDGKPVSFHSALVPPYVRKSASLEAALPWLYLKGISTGEMQPALEVLLGSQAKGLSASTVSRLKQIWRAEYETWQHRRLDDDRWVYIWADGIYSGLRAERQRLCALVIVGVDARGEKHFLAIEDGIRESTQSWREVLLDLKARGMNAPELAIGDGALGFWAALEEVFSATRQQRCWMHKTGNVLNAMPKSVQPKAKSALHEIWQAATCEDAERAFDQFIVTYEAKYPKATNCLLKDRESLMTFYDFPAVHWQHLRTTNPIESTFATIRHRTTRMKRCVTRDSMLHMIFKLGQCAEKNWRKLRGFKYLAKVVEGVTFVNGEEIEQPNQVAA